MNAEWNISQFTHCRTRLGHRHGGPFVDSNKFKTTTGLGEKKKTKSHVWKKKE
jgi:hypothetical protein